MQSTSNRSKILVVEDDVDIQHVLCAYLEYSGFEVCSASDGREAINIIPDFSPDLIVLDLMMRPVDGWEVLQWLRRRALTPPVPVLVLTALSNLSEQVHGFEEGAFDYMTKPTQPGMIAERIRTLLSLSVEQRALLRRKRIDEQRRIWEHVSTPLPDEFVF